MFRRFFVPRLAGFGLAALLALPASAQQPAQAPLSAEQRTAVEALIKDVLLKNPEIIQEALVELERRQQQAQVDAQRQVLVTERAAIFNAAQDAVAGNPNGDVTIVEFFDYNCGFCKRSLTDMQEILKQDNRLRVVLKDFPILGADSVEAARVAIAVKSQLKGERYWNFHVALMSSRGRVNAQRALDVAREHGANLDQVRRDMESAEVRGAIEQNVVLGDRLGLTGTPAFIMGEEIIFGAVGADAIKSRVTAMRRCGRTNCG